MFLTVALAKNKDWLKETDVTDKPNLGKKEKTELGIKHILCALPD